MYKNWKIAKSVINYIGSDEELQKQAQEAQDEYTNVANWCNEGGEYHIEDTGDYYEVVKNAEPTTEELQEQVRGVCSQYINEISWRVERYNTQKELGIETSDSAEIYLSILEYMQYLREYDDQSGEWWLSYPETFDEWRDLDESSVN